MKIKNIVSVFSLGLLAVLASACSTAKLSTQTSDDVYFSDIAANEVVYTSVKNNAPIVEDNYDDNLNYYDEGVYNSRLNGFNNYSWRDYYYQNNGLFFDPFLGGGFNSFNNFYGGNNFFNNGWSFNLGFGRPFGGFNNFYDPFFSPWNNFNSFYGYGAFGYGYGNIYSFYRPVGFYGGGFGNYGFGNNYFFDPLVDNRPNNPRPRGSYDNVRSGGRTGSGNIALPPSGRPVRPDGMGGSTPTRTVDGTRNPSSSGTSVRPTRPTGSSSSGTTTTRPTQSTTPSSRPTRVERPTSPPPPTRSTDSGSSSSSRSSGGSSSGGGSGSTSRPTRPGGN